MKNDLNKFDKYLGKRVKITKRNGKSFYLNVRGSGKDEKGEYISGFDDERMNDRIYLDGVVFVQVAEEVATLINDILKKVKR